MSEKSDRTRTLLNRIAGALALLILVLNAVVFYLYWRIDKPLEYFDSKSYEALLVSAVIPLLIWSVSSSFKIGEKLAAEKKLAEDEKIKSQFAAIQQTDEIWSELFRLSTEVAYFQKNTDGRVAIGDLIKKLELFSNRASEMVHNWNRSFPGTAQAEMNDFFQETNTFVSVFNVLLESVASVAVAIEQDDLDRQELQGCLLLIQDEVRLQVQQYIPMYFYLRVKGEKESAKAWGKAVSQWFDEIKQALNTVPNLPLASPAVQKRAKLEVAYKEFKNKTNPAGSDPLEVSPELDEYAKSIETSQPMAQIVAARSRPYSTEQIRCLVRFIFKKQDLEKIKESI